YGQVLSEITLEEWEQALFTTCSNSAPAPVLRRLGKYTTWFCTEFL
ncbi:12695_t:CDS:1, partial [Gigaspora rosea]